MRDLSQGQSMGTVAVAPAAPAMLTTTFAEGPLEVSSAVNAAGERWACC